MATRRDLLLAFVTGTSILALPSLGPESPAGAASEGGSERDRQRHRPNRRRRDRARRARRTR